LEKGSRWKRVVLFPDWSRQRLAEGEPNTRGSKTKERHQDGAGPDVSVKNPGVETKGNTTKQRKRDGKN